MLDQVKPWENVRLCGEDIKRGALLAASGEVMTPGLLSLLAANGIGEVKVGRQPRVGLLATGSELREPGQSLAPGQIYESNRPALLALIRRAGGQPRVWPLVQDTFEATRQALKAAFDQCDIVVTSGGVSVGEMDFVKQAFEEIKGTLELWKVNIKPGRPFVFGRCEDKLLFGLPGNPVSALVTFLLLVRPALLRWQGAVDASLPSHPAVLIESLENRGDRPHFVRVKVDSSGRVASAGVQASHRLRSLAAASGLVRVPPQTVLAAGTAVQVSRWE